MRNDSHVTLPVGFMRDLAASTSQEEALVATAHWMPSMIASERSSISLPFDDDHLKIYTLGGSLVIQEGSLLRIDASLVGQAFVTQKIVNIADLANSTSQEAPALSAAGLQSALVCPIVVAGCCLGTVNLGNTDVGFFTTEHESLMRSVVDLIASFLRMHALARAEQERADTDHLTGVMSRRGILDHLDTKFDVAQSEIRPSLLYLDVDGFKGINDNYGHLFGDVILRQIAERMQTVIRKTDRVGRLGGDEFLVVVDNDPTGQSACQISNRIETVCSTPFTVGSLSMQLRLSMGLASIETSESTATEVLHDADQALYVAKASRHSMVVANKAIRDKSIMIAAIDRDLDHGLESGQICYHYQPIRDLKTRRVAGAEALIRWTHPEIGEIPAMLLIDRFEKTGRIEALTRWSVNTVAEQWAEVRAQVPWCYNRAIAINLSPRQLDWDGYADFHLETLERHRFSPSDIVVEVVESSEIERGTAAEANLQKLGANGVKIALDDFGTGHNALGYLTMFPIHSIKLDSSLVSSSDTSKVARTVLSSLASMFSDLGLVSLGEGIETEAEALVCEQLGIELGQGWHLGRPVSLDKFMQVLAREPVPNKADTEKF